MTDLTNAGFRAKSFPFPDWVGDMVPFAIEKATWIQADNRLKKLMIEHGSKFTEQSYLLETNGWIRTPFKEEGSSSSDDEKDHKRPPMTDVRLGKGLSCTTFEGRQLYMLYTSLRDVMYHGVKEPDIDEKEAFFVLCEGLNQLEFIQRFIDTVLAVEVPEPTIREPLSFPIYRWSHRQEYWKRENDVNGRSMESVVLPQETKDRITSDFDSFLSEDTKAWYTKYGIPYKRSYLFFGVPGTGKTSLIKALASKYMRSVCFLHPHHPRFTDDAFKSCMMQVPENAVVVLEDIDALFDKNRRKLSSGNVPLTFTGLLNGIDGIGHSDGMILICTTNFVDRLDEALIRAGRMDMKVEFKCASHEQLSMMFRRFYEEASEELCQKFADAILVKFPESLALAELQQHFIDHRCSSAEECLTGITTFRGKTQAQEIAELDKCPGEPKRKACPLKKADSKDNESDSDSDSDSDEEASVPAEPAQKRTKPTEKLALITQSVTINGLLVMLSAVFGLGLFSYVFLRSCTPEC